MSDNLTKKPHVFRNLRLATPSAIALLASALGGTLASGVTRANTDKVAPIQRMTLTVDTTIALTDATTAGTHGSKKLYDFAEGGVLILAATAKLAVSESGGLDADADLICGLGSAAAGTNNGTLTGTEADIIPSTTATLVSSAGNFRAMSTAGAWLNGASAAAAIYLNTVAVDADTTSNATLTVTGTVEVFFIHLGDFIP